MRTVTRLELDTEPGRVMSPNDPVNGPNDVSLPPAVLMKTFTARFPGFFQVTRWIDPLTTRDARPGLRRTRLLSVIVNGLLSPASSTPLFEVVHSTCTM